MVIREYEPNPIIVRKAVAIWRGAILVPRYDNGADDLQNRMAQVLASRLPSNADEPGVLDKFCDELQRLLTTKLRFDRDTDFKPIDDTVNGYFQVALHVDYGPDLLLTHAAKVAGLRMEFPWKTYMSLDGRCLVWRNGYSAMQRYYYPLDAEGSRWLVTTLSGDDIDKIIAAVQAGVDLGLTIE